MSRAIEEVVENEANQDTGVTDDKHVMVHHARTPPGEQTNIRTVLLEDQSDLLINGAQ